MAFACAVNLTEVNIDVNNRLGQVPNQLIPPGLAPAGSYNPDITTPWSLDLPRAAELLVDAMMHPMTSFTYYNGTRIPAGVIDNRFGDTNGDGKAEITYTIEVYCGAADTFTQKVLTTISTNLNAMAADVSRGGNATGLRFAVVPVPGGQQYTLASRHQIYAYWGGWVADYNHVIDWLGPMYSSSQTYCSWNQMNYTTLDNYVENAIAADEAGNIDNLLYWNNLANEFADEQVLYFYTAYPLTFFVRSSYLKGWYFNAALSSEYFAPMSYEELTPPTLSVELSQIPDYPLPGQEVKIYANITEPAGASGVKSPVFFFYRANGEPWWNTTMVFNETLGLFERTIPPQSEDAVVEYFVRAIDNAGNVNTTEIHSYIVLSSDVNHDGTVSVQDLFIIGKAFGSHSGEAGYNPEADVNKDGIIDNQDLKVVNMQYGKVLNRV
jgi:hypothetical protein